MKFRMGVTLKNVFRSIGPPGFPRLVPMCLHVEMRFPQIPGNVKKKKRIVFFFVLCAFVFVCLIFFHSSFSKAAMRERTTFLLVSTDSPFRIISSRIAYTCSPENVIHSFVQLSKVVRIKMVRISLQHTLKKLKTRSSSQTF